MFSPCFWASFYSLSLLLMGSFMVKVPNKKEKDFRTFLKLSGGKVSFIMCFLFMILLGVKLIKS